MSNAKHFALLLSVCGGCFAQSVGLFDGHADVGTVLHAGSVVFDEAAKSYTITGSGENMWATADAFHFVWKKVSGDIMLTADISFPTKTGDAHKKGVLMIRQSLDAGSAYADAALHGNGLTSLQARDQAGAATHEIQANVTGPRRLRIEKRGAYLYMSVGEAGEEPHFSGGSMKVALEGEFYIGLGVCAHNKDAEEQAVFSNVELKEPAKGKTKLYSTMETITVSSTDRRVTAVMPERLGSPNWAKDGRIIFARKEGLASIPVDGGEVRGVLAARVEGIAVSPDGKMLAYGSPDGVFVAPMSGGAPRRLAKGPAVVGGWSPDGAQLIFDGKHGIRTIASRGGKGAPGPKVAGHNFRPQYSPDGRFIYFDSDQSGSMQVWRMAADGSDAEQLTSDGERNGSPHVSPDGRRMVFLSLQSDGEMLRMMSFADKKVTALARFRGSLVSLGSAAWSPDGRRVVLISYQERP